MGESVTEGTILGWLKRVGDEVDAEEPLVEVSTDKVDAELPAPVSGTLTKILAEADSTVSVGAVLGEIEVNGGRAAPAEAEELVEVAFPEMGDSVAEGTVLEWKVAVGDAVSVDDPLVEISTDKVDAEVPSPAAGTVAEILVEPDATVSVGSILCRIEPGAGAPSGPVQPAAEATEERPAADRAPVGSGNGAANATPVAARIASAEGVDLGSVEGSGPRGRVTKEDVLAAIEGNGDSTAPATPGAEVVPIRGPAATLVRFMDESRSIPTATSFRTLPVDVLDARRKDLKAAGKKLSFTHLIAWAVVQAARDMPVMGHGFAEADGKPQRIAAATISLGLAVDVERKDGTRSLVVPVLRDASELGFAEFVARYDELVAGARDNTLAPDAYQGANISLTNPGGIGTVASVPRLMPGQGTIVATGAIGYPPGLDAADPEKLEAAGVRIQKVMTMTSTYDHRVIQGAESGAFLRRIEELLEGEDGFYDGVFEALELSGVAEGGSKPAAVTAAEPVPAAATPSASPLADASLLQAVQAATSLVKAHRMHGHLAATLDPLGAEPVGDPALDPATVNLTEELMRRIPASVLRVAVEGDTFADALPRLRDTYTGTISYEIEHISEHEQRVWLRQAIESGEYRRPLPPEEKRYLLQRLSETEALETYLHKAFLGKKQFSIEGLDSLVPMLDDTIELAAEAGAREVVLGMAHRGRLNVLAHTVGRPYASILVEFEGEQMLSKDTAAPEGGTGDVKYHYGASGTYTTRSGRSLTVTMSPNPSHLEYVNPVIEGRARADQTTRKGREPAHDPNAVLPVLIHGDAAFPGQGIVAETLNLQALAGYSTGGTIHVIANNQLGFTTDPHESRSTRYASDLAKGFDIPIIHVNADDVEACIAAVRLAHAYRQAFNRDALIDLIGYRRFGHNETDEPAYTQPAMYERIKEHPPVRKLYAERLAGENVVTPDEAKQIEEQAYQAVADAHTELKESMAGPPETGQHEIDRTMSREPRTTIPEDTLRSLNEQLLRVPEGFEVHRKLRPFLERRRAAFAEADGSVDWAHAEALAIASLLASGRSRSPHRAGHRARHVQPASRGAARRRGELVRAAAPARCQRPLRAAQFSAVRAGLHGLRVRLQRAGAGRARALGSAVRRLRQLGAGHRRPVPHLRPGQVGADLATEPAPAAWIRGIGPRALERAPRALPADGRGGQHTRCQLHDARPVLPPAAPPSPGVQAPTAGGDDAEEPAAPARGHVHRAGAGRGLVPACDRRSGASGRARSGDHARVVLRQGLLRHRGPRGAPRHGAYRGGAGRAALPVPRGRADRVDQQLPQPRTGGVGPGGAAQHGCARLHAPAHGEDPARASSLRLRRAPAARCAG